MHEDFNLKTSDDVQKLKPVRLSVATVQAELSAIAQKTVFSPSVQASYPIKSTEADTYSLGQVESD